jgi:predicted TPR repeat methyltransferase
MKVAEPPLAEALATAIDHLKHERLDSAEPALLGVLARWPGQPDALHFLGVLRHAQGDTGAGIECIRAALASLPDHAGAWNNLGNLLLLDGRADEAVDAYAHAVRHAGDDHESALALNNLCCLHRRLGALGDSELAARQAIERAPDFGDAWYNLSLTLLKQGRVHDGLVANSRAVALWPQNAQPRHEVIRALMLLDERERAAELLRDWLTEDADNPVAAHLLAACGGDATPDRASDRYVEEVFDGFAASFDAKLEDLGYRAPALVTTALESVAGPPAAALDICDAGCGTGLCGPGLRPWARSLSGCDLSVGMLRRAETRKLYDRLHQAELTYYLATQPAAFDAVVSADTLCYFGVLGDAVQAAHQALRPGGWLIFTVEALADDEPNGHRLQTNGRYAHRHAYLRAALTEAGFERVDLRADTLRMEAGEPVAGWVVSGRKSAG